MKIINNINNSHFETIKTLTKKSDELIFFSPFCYQDFEYFLQKILHSKIKKITLVTTLKPTDARFKAYSFVSFVEKLKKKKIEWEIQIDNKLHGKMYFFKKSSTLINAIITSANLTGNGMKRNHEWGYLLNDKNDIQQLLEQAQSVIYEESLSEEKINEVMKKVEEYIKTHPKNKKIDLININDILKNTTGIAWEPEIKIFIKPYGHSEDKIYDGDFSEEKRQHFSKKEPKSVDIDDLLICYAVGSTKLISVFKVLSEPKNTKKKNDRWPWYVDVQNLTPGFGKKWFNYDYTLSKVSKQFLKEHKKCYLTNNGGKTLGALQYGSDKIQLTNEFGAFLIDLIEGTEV